MMPSFWFLVWFGSPLAFAALVVNAVLLGRLLFIGGIILSLLDDLISDVEDENTLTNSVITLLDGISQKLAEAGTDGAKLAHLKTMIDQNKANISAAILANTPSAPTSPSTGSAPTGSSSTQAAGQSGGSASTGSSAGTSDASRSSASGQPHDAAAGAAPASSPPAASSA